MYKIKYARIKFQKNTVTVYNQHFQLSSHEPKEYVAVFIESYKENGAVSHVGSDFLTDWTLYIHHRTHRGIDSTGISS